jgi:hypothetical protein
MRVSAPLCGSGGARGGRPPRGLALGSPARGEVLALRRPLPRAAARGRAHVAAVCEAHPRTGVEMEMAHAARIGAKTAVPSRQHAQSAGARGMEVNRAAGGVIGAAARAGDARARPMGGDTRTFPQALRTRASADLKAAGRHDVLAVAAARRAENSAYSLSVRAAAGFDIAAEASRTAHRVRHVIGTPVAFSLGERCRRPARISRGRRRRSPLRGGAGGGDPASAEMSRGGHEGEARVGGGSPQGRRQVNHPGRESPGRRAARRRRARVVVIPPRSARASSGGGFVRFLLGMPGGMP